MMLSDRNLVNTPSLVETIWFLIFWEYGWTSDQLTQTTRMGGRCPHAQLFAFSWSMTRFRCLWSFFDDSTNVLLTYGFENSIYRSDFLDTRLLLYAEKSILNMESSFMFLGHSFFVIISSDEDDRRSCSITNDHSWRGRKKFSTQFSSSVVFYSLRLRTPNIELRRLYFVRMIWWLSFNAHALP